MQSTDFSSPGYLALDGELTIFTAVEQQSKLLEAIATGLDMDVDLCGVSEIDAAGLQLMVAAKQYATSTGKHLRFINHSDPVLGMLDLCDLVGYFGDPVVVFSATRKTDTEDRA